MDAERLQEIYDSLPTVDCKGHCWNSCGPIDMSPLEWMRIEERGVEIPEFTPERSRLWAMDLPLHCPALDPETKRCTVYDVRPLICRLWGVTESMPCPHGCEVTPGVMSDEEAMTLIAETMGQETDIAEILNDPELGPAMKKFLRDGDEEALIRALEQRGIHAQ